MTAMPSLISLHPITMETSSQGRILLSPYHSFIVRLSVVQLLLSSPLYFHCLSYLIFFSASRLVPLSSPHLSLPSQFTSALCLCAYSITFQFKPVPEPRNVRT